MKSIKIQHYKQLFDVLLYTHAVRQIKSVSEEQKKKYTNRQNKTDCRDTKAEVWAIINYTLSFEQTVNKNQGSTRQWFLFTAITDVLESQT